MAANFREPDNMIECRDCGCSFNPNDQYHNVGYRNQCGDCAREKSDNAGTDRMGIPEYNDFGEVIGYKVVDKRTHEKWKEATAGTGTDD